MTGLRGTGQLSLSPSSQLHCQLNMEQDLTEATPMARGEHLPGSGHEGGVESIVLPSPPAYVGLGMPKRTPELCIYSSINANISLTKISGTCSPPGHSQVS